MSLILRAGKAEDAAITGQICYEAFKTIADRHNFPHDFPVAEAAIGLTTMLLNRPGIYSVIAEQDGEIVGSNFLWEGNQVSGVGPITINPNVQNSSIGRSLMEDVIRRSDEQGFLSIRLVQAAYHNRSLALYTKLGFNPVEPLSAINGSPLNIKIEGFDVRPANENDLAELNNLNFRVHGHTREQDLRDAIAQNPYRCRRSLSERRLSAPDAQRRNSALVSRKRLKNHPAADLDEPRLVSGTARRVYSLDTFLIVQIRRQKF
jgi:GNAT superfamily N-acetyltransferase